MAKRIVIGRVGTDPEIKEVKPGLTLAKFRLAESGWDPLVKEATTTWWDVSGFDGMAQTIKDRVAKGMRVYVHGMASVYSGAAGDKDQIKAWEVGSADRFVAGSSAPAEGDSEEW